MNRVKEFCNQPRLEVNCSELIGKSKSKVVTFRKYSKRMVNTFHVIEGIAVEGGGQGGRLSHSVQNVKNCRKFGQMVNLLGQIFWIFGHTIAKIPSQFR